MQSSSAIGGLLISTFVTIVFVPILYTLFEDAESALRRLFIHRSSDIPTSPALPPGRTLTDRN